MSDNIVELIAQYGLETILIAVLINILSAIIKTPVKHFAKKTKNSTRITRFIVLVPIIIGFIVTLCYKRLIVCDESFGKEFVTLWLTSSSLSLTIYAVMEKMIPSKKSVLQDSEEAMTEKIIDRLQSIADGVFNKESTREQEKEAATTEVDQKNEEQLQKNDTNEHQPFKKIVLRGASHVQNESKE